MGCSLGTALWVAVSLVAIVAVLSMLSKRFGSAVVRTLMMAGWVVLAVPYMRITKARRKDGGPAAPEHEPGGDRGGAEHD